MLLNSNIQIPFKNTSSTVVKAGDAFIVGLRTQQKAILGVAVADVALGEKGLLETSGIFSIDENSIKNVGIYQQVYAFNDSPTSKARFTLTPSESCIYAGISLTDRATEGGPLILALGYNSQVYKAPASNPSSAPSGEKDRAMNDTPTTVDPSNTSGHGVI